MSKLIMVWAILLVLVETVVAQSLDWPNRNVMVVSSVAAGNGSDVIGRIVAQELADRLGQSFIVENKPGSGVKLAAMRVETSPADGYTIMFTAAHFLSSQAIAKSLRIDNEQFVPISLIGDSLFVLVAKAGRYKDIRQLISTLREVKTPVLMATTGYGGQGHFIIKDFHRNAKFEGMIVPYKKTSETLIDVIAGRLDIVAQPVSVVLPYVKDGKLDALAVVADRRIPLLPDVPTFAELGFTETNSIPTWMAFLVKKGTDPYVIQKLSSTLENIKHSPEFVQRMLDLGVVVQPDRTISQLREKLDQDSSLYHRLAKELGIKTESDYNDTKP